MGPFNRYVNRRAAKSILPQMKHIFARGATTKRHLDRLALTNVSVCPDLAFHMDLKAVDSSKINDVLSHMNGNIVGISPSSVLYRHCLRQNIDYLQIMKQFCAYLTERWDFNILLIPHSFRKTPGS